MQDELDILREIGSIAASHGSIALSQILGRRIYLQIPTVDLLPCNKVSTRIDTNKLGIVVKVKVVTGLKGDAAFILDEKNAFTLIGLSCEVKSEDKTVDVLTEMGISALKEIGNIVTGAYLSAIGLMLKRVVLTLPPTLISGPLDEILSLILAGSAAEDYALVIEAVFEEERDRIKGGFYLVLAQDSASDIREACKQLLDEFKK